MHAAIEPCTSDESADLPRRVNAALARASATVATAESCTGGLIAKQLTDVAGSSAVFVGAIVAYANRAKMELLGVGQDLLVAHGAVSAEVARAMAEGCRSKCGTDYAVAVTGVAGPGGGTPDKPVGLVYVAAAAHQRTEVHELRLAPELGRDGIRQATTQQALRYLLDLIGS